MNLEAIDFRRLSLAAPCESAYQGIIFFSPFFFLLLDSFWSPVSPLLCPELCELSALLPSELCDVADEPLALSVEAAPLDAPGAAEFVAGSAVVGWAAGLAPG
jgi:hypothetical protein